MIKKHSTGAAAAVGAIEKEGSEALLRSKPCAYLTTVEVVEDHLHCE
jgi:hypothetical protein